MSAIIAIFDDGAALTEAVDTLHGLGLDDVTMSILGGAEHEDVPLPGAGPAVLPGAAPAARGAGVAVRGDRVPAPASAAVDEELADLVDNEEQLRFYADVIAHDGRLLALRVADTDAERVSEVLEACGASHVDRQQDDGA